MKRKITIIVEDEKSSQNFSGITTLRAINELYNIHKINGITQLLIVLNSEINTAVGENLQVALPNEITTLPKGKKW